MTQKAPQMAKLVGVGVAIGACLGLAVVNYGDSPPDVAPDAMESVATASSEQVVPATQSGPNLSESDHVATAQPIDPRQEWARRMMAGGLSLREMAIVSEILNGQGGQGLDQAAYGRSYDNQRGQTVDQYDGPSLRNSDYGPTHRSIDEGYDSGSSTPMPMASARGTERASYRGQSGTSYQYDLSDPAQRLRYETDPVAQLRDSVSVDPRRGLDQSIGQYGGGIER